MTSEKFIHIVCLDAPAPPNYGGAIDMFYKIKALYNAGAKITLHYFQYNNRNADALKRYCVNIFTYKRKSLAGFSLSLPYIISSRINNALINYLDKDDFPILLEGIHCTGIIPYLKNKNRHIVIRVHNDEAVYYHRLAKAERNFFKKFYFIWESRQLLHYQKRLPNNVSYALLSLSDIETFKKSYSLEHLYFIPSFIPWQELSSYTGTGSYCLYHGNMAISENEEAAMWLLKNIFKKTKTAFIIAGNGITERLKKEASKYNITYYNNPSTDDLNGLICNAQINIIHSVNSTGVKLKLLHALCKGRHCIANTAGIDGSALNHGFLQANTASEYIELIGKTFPEPFTEQMIQKRKGLLQIYNNEYNAQQLIGLLYSHYQ